MGPRYYLRTSSRKYRTTRFDPSARPGRRPRLQVVNLIAVSLSIWWFFGLTMARSSEVGPPRPSFIMLNRTLTQDLSFAFDQLVAWPFADYVFGSDWDVMSDVTKSRLHGFHDVVDSEAMFERLLRRFRREKIVP